ncbi:MAG: hypothetical protein UY41_C0019G0003 [Candidatus Moranbacteria bacterium GW2011_GWE1_49_15]|nr:MAG: hypothetical protein UX75_C0018G0009 [Candidatus Moranbacteria bacterium GW2011_GWE2_47_10]KKW06615.1 MAG: hypothetical protein UY41_C0019G0003 [Candidatus Moranbacteria bacterium GW2011_GWE1_49_15]
MCDDAIESKKTIKVERVAKRKRCSYCHRLISLGRKVHYWGGKIYCSKCWRELVYRDPGYPISPRSKLNPRCFLCLREIRGLVCRRNKWSFHHLCYYHNVASLLFEKFYRKVRIWVRKEVNRRSRP